MHGVLQKGGLMEVLFIHVPKTAGSSIDRYLRRVGNYQNLADGTLRPVLDPNKQWISSDHVSIGSLMARGVFDRQWLNSRFKVAFVRNPWDRLVSLYFYLSGYRLNQKRRRMSNSYLGDFKTFVRTVHSGRFVNPIGKLNTDDWSQANPQMDWLRWGVDFVGRFERLEDDWKRLCEVTGLPHKPLEVARKTNHEHYTVYYDNELRDLVTEIYEEDIDTFGYRFGN